MFRFGLAGIPLSCKGRTLKDAIEDTHRMGLHALEIQFLRVNVQERNVIDEVGLKPREVEDSIILPDSEIRDAGRIVESVIGRGVKILKGNSHPLGKKLVIGDNSRIIL